MPTATTWEVMVDSYFINPDVHLQYYIVDWIAYITDVLSGDNHPYSGRQREEGRRAWFVALNDVTDEELARVMR